MNYRSSQYLQYIRTQASRAPAIRQIPGPMVAAHQRLAGGNAGVAIKPHDTFALPLTEKEHQLEHMGSASFWRGRDRYEIMCEMVAGYISKTYGHNGWRWIIESVTQRMIDEGL